MTRSDCQLETNMCLLVQSYPHILVFQNRVFFSTPWRMVSCGPPADRTYSPRFWPIFVHVSGKFPATPQDGRNAHGWPVVAALGIEATSGFTLDAAPAAGTRRPTEAFNFHVSGARRGAGGGHSAPVAAAPSHIPTCGDCFRCCPLTEAECARFLRPSQMPH